MFDESFDWESLPCSTEPPYTACGEPDDLLTMDLDLKHVPQLDTYIGDFAPTIDEFFKSHTPVSKGWRSWCQRVHPPFMDILQKVQLVHIVLVFFGLDISQDSENLLSLLYCWNSTTHTFFTGCQEGSPSLEDVYKILRLPLFGDGEMANISMSFDEGKIVEFLDNAMKKTLKKSINALLVPTF